MLLRLMFAIVLVGFAGAAQAQCPNGACSPRGQVVQSNPISVSSQWVTTPNYYQPGPMPTGQNIVWSTPRVVSETIISERVVHPTQRIVTSSCQTPSVSYPEVKSNPTEQCQCDAGGVPCQCDPCTCGDRQSVYITSLQEKPLARITVFTNDPCVHCDLWKQNEMSKYVKQGWDVQEVSNYTAGVVPRFKIEYKGYEFIHNGFMSVDAFKNIVNLTK